jgi:hypothetical protein
MQLPFIPAGLLIALAVLGGTLVVFGLALKALAWTIDASRDSALVGIVSGLRDWRMTAEPDEASAPATADTLPAGSIEETGEPIEDPAEPIQETAEPVRLLERVVPDQPTGRGGS